MILLPKFVEEAIGIGLVETSIVYGVHAFIYTINANLIRRRAYDRAMPLVSPVYRFVRLTGVPLPKNPRRGESRKGMCLGNSREWTNFQRIDDPLVENVANYKDYREVPYVCVIQDSHDGQTQKPMENNGDEEGRPERRWKSAAPYLPSKEGFVT